MKVGFIGLGHMGSAMARRLSEADVDLVVWNRSGARAPSLRATIAASPAELAAQADVVFMSLADSDAVRAVLAGPDGVLTAALAGKVVIDMTTNHFDAVGSFHEMVAASGGHYLETPVIGSVAPAAQGALTILVSGSSQAFERVRPYLEIVGSKIFFLEQPGRATKLKLINNFVLGSLMCTLAEAVVFGEEVGLDKSTVLDILAAGAGASAILTGRRAKLESDDFGSDFTITLMYKDLHYAQDLARVLERPLFTGSIAKECFALGLRGETPNEDIAAVYKALRGF